MFLADLLGTTLSSIHNFSLNEECHCNFKNGLINNFYIFNLSLKHI